MCDFLRVIAWFCDEKFSLKKSCFYLYIRRRYEHSWPKTIGSTIFVYASSSSVYVLVDIGKDVGLQELWGRFRDKYYFVQDLCRYLYHI